MLDYLRIMLDARSAKMDERGASAVEYGLLIAGIAALIVVVVFAFGGALSATSSRTPATRSPPATGDLLTSAPDWQWPRTGVVRGHCRLRPRASRPDRRSTSCCDTAHRRDRGPRRSPRR